MKRLIGLMTAMVLAAGPVTAQVTFDDLAGVSPISNGYSGFNWGGFWALDGCDFHIPSGYCAGTVSGAMVAFNGFAAPVVITGPASFLFGGAWFTGAWRNNLQLDITGLFQGNVLYSTTLNLNVSNPQFFAANWGGIDELRFNSYGGVDAGVGGNPNDFHFAMDNISFEAVSTVPEPATMTLLATGLAGMAAARRRRKA